MNDFSIRSKQKELLDGDHIPFDDIVQNMKELNFINSKLGGHFISITGLKNLLTLSKNQINKNDLVVCEIGCGGGDNIKALHQWCKKNNIKASFVGVDIKKECIDFAVSRCKDIPVKWITSPYEKVNFSTKPSIIFSSLFCHHFLDNEIVDMLNWMKKNSATGFFINDLQRSSVAYFFIKWLTRFFSSSYLVKHDAALSVARSFVKKDWQSYFKSSTIHNYSISWKWAFRYLIIVKH
jgi:2-polyprenyl-3-methyl-5-hydroxy-6-metoxy-1,4-benzoquinol methylase